MKKWRKLHESFFILEKYCPEWGSGTDPYLFNLKCWIQVRIRKKMNTDPTPWVKKVDIIKFLFFNELSVTLLVRAAACRMPQNLVVETMGLASSSSWAGSGVGSAGDLVSCFLMGERREVMILGTFCTVNPPLT